MRKIYKYFEYFYTKVVQKFRQKKYIFDGIVLKYMLYKNSKSQELIIVFSACTREGIKARYNYVRTLKKIKANKLFILDDFGIDKRGEYYLGEAPDFKCEKAVENLINSYIKKYEKIYYVGSSKGGYAALNFGLKNNNSVIICGAPQFHLGNYLAEPPFKITYESMKLNKKYVNYLNNKIESEIKRKSENIKIYIHYSKIEHTYKEHVMSLIKLIKNNDIMLEEDIKEYNNHNDVSLYFPQFLIRVLRKEVRNEKSINGWK